MSWYIELLDNNYGGSMNNNTRNPTRRNKNTWRCTPCLICS